MVTFHILRLFNDIEAFPHFADDLLFPNSCDIALNEFIETRTANALVAIANQPITPLS